MRKFIIRSLDLTDEEDGAPLYWNNEDGWGHFTTATIFTEQERNSINPPMGSYQWKEIVDVGRALEARYPFGYRSEDKEP